VNIYPIGEGGKVEPLINSIVDEYEVSDKGYSDLETALLEEWSIFNKKFSEIEGGETPAFLVDLLKELCAAFRRTDDVYSRIVTLRHTDDDYAMSEYGIVSGWDWESFSEEIKRHNRFHNNLFNPEITASFLTYAVKTYPVKDCDGKDIVFFRARRADSIGGRGINEMGAPPSEKSEAGRISPEGISVLYLASDAETALSEIRASTYDFVSVGEFKPKKAVRVVSLPELANISPFLYLADNNDLWQYAINHHCLRDFSDAVSKPLRRNDSLIDYLPTQFMAEFIKSERYDGVEYKSVMNPGGTNIAIFDESLFDCTGVQTVEVSRIQFETEPQIDCASVAIQAMPGVGIQNKA
jgi:hypothetical protein